MKHPRDITLVEDDGGPVDKKPRTGAGPCQQNEFVVSNVGHSVG